MEERWNLNAVPDPLLSALPLRTGRALTSGAVVGKPNKAPTVKKIRHYLVLACDGAAPGNLLLLLFVLYQVLAYASALRQGQFNNTYKER